MNEISFTNMLLYTFRRNCEKNSNHTSNLSKGMLTANVDPVRSAEKINM